MDNYSKVCTELYEIFKYMPKQEIEKLPEELKKAIEEKKDNNYSYKVTNISDFENQEMMNETRAVLAVLYRDYWASKEEKEKIRAQEKKEIFLIEQEKKEKYSYEDLFKKQKETDMTEGKECLEMISKKENIFTKFFKFIIKIFKPKNKN